MVIVVNLLIESEREEWEEEGKAKGTKELHRYPSPYDSPTFLTACFSMAGSIRLAMFGSEEGAAKVLAVC